MEHSIRETRIGKGEVIGVKHPEKEPQIIFGRVSQTIRNTILAGVFMGTSESRNGVVVATLTLNRLMTKKVASILSN